MTLSIIIPVYNVEEYLDRCINSVLCQYNVKIELILINDGSIDNSGILCDEYARKDKRVKVYHQDNKGVSFARNLGIKNATGNWICFIDADDWIEKGSLEKLIKEIIDENNNVDFIVARSFINKDGIIGNERYAFNQSWKNSTFKGTDLVINHNYARGSVWGVIYRRNFLINNSIKFPLNIINGEDTIFASLIFIYAKYIRFSNVHFYNIYEREGSASRSWSFERVLRMTECIEFLNNYIKMNEHLPKDAISILNYNKYRIVSSIYNNFHHSFSLKNYFLLRFTLKEKLKEKIDIGNIRKFRNKVEILNFSLDLFAISILIKNFLKNLIR